MPFCLGSVITFMQLTSQREVNLLRFLLLLTVVLLLTGLLSPMLTMSQFYFFESSFSVVGGLVSLFEEGQYFIAIVILIFSVLAPIAKVLFLFHILKEGVECSVKQKHYLSLIHDYGRWAMLDVFVVAVLIMTVKLGAIVSIEIHWGLYVFAGAVILIMYLTHKVVKLFHVDS